jgi:hypothetical protein
MEAVHFSEMMNSTGLENSTLKNLLFAFRVTQFSLTFSMVR